ncbi:MAG TPA: hypothetical protein VMA09_11230 [Candidatus Binataceae bacterium]|nr:hypothetical protein [Candidatus Binataceae bacterium]
MSSAELPDDPERQQSEQAESGRDNDSDSDSMASKLSKELNNWRRKRTSGRPRRVEGPSQNYQSEPARTIKVRGHETLVIRKPKLASKPPTNPTE